MRKIVVIGALLVSALALAGCGGGSGSEAESSTPAEARAEIGEIRTLLDAAVGTYESGDEKAAADQVGDIYLEHYEHVEGPLGERNHDLMEELEEQISTKLRGAMRDGKPVAEVKQLVAEIRKNLDKAEAELA